MGEEESKDEGPSQATTYGEAKEISKDELSGMWSKFPYAVQKSLNLAKKNKLPKVTDAELHKLMDEFFAPKK